MNVVACIRGALLAYLAGSLFCMVHAFFHRKWLRSAAGAAVGFAFTLHSIVLVHRIWVSGRLPFSNMYETLLFFSWLLVLISWMLERRYRLFILGTFTTPIALLILAGTSLLPPDVERLMPSLRSNWLIIHVSTCFLAYTAFAIAFASSTLFFIFMLMARRKPGLKTEFEKRCSVMDAITYRTITLGFPFLTLGIITGSVWADLCWGTYWSWDPKETWSLVTWLIYGVCLHLRHTDGMKGGWAALASIVGFASVVCTYFGVNYLFSTLHAYA